MRPNARAGFPFTYGQEITMRKTYAQPRSHAFHLQAGRCFYCECLMWQGNDLETFRTKHDLTEDQVLQLRCTAEHVIARCDGGSDDASNIVAACHYCNLKRHACLQAKNSKNYAKHVRAKIRLKEWHLFDPDCHGLLPVKETFPPR